MLTRTGSYHLPSQFCSGLGSFLKTGLAPTAFNASWVDYLGDRLP